MSTNAAICKKIVSLYPDIGICGIDINVLWDTKEKTWRVHLKKETHELDHYLSTLDANRCVEGKECVSLGLEIAQLQRNIEGRQF
jgi:hypothetical protein